MLQCNLRVIMAKKKLTATKISADTHISRVTLGALINNQAKGVQFETLNTLCSYLGVSPGELFEFAPFDVETTRVLLAENEIIVDIRDGSRTLECRIPMMVDVGYERVDIDADAWMNVPNSLFLVVGKDADQSTDQFMRYYNSLSSELQIYVQNQIESAVCGAVVEDCAAYIPDWLTVDLQVESRFFGEK